MPQPQTPFEASLLPASFRGLPFGVLEKKISTGRRLAVHEYPFRDRPYAEDLGRRARRIAFSAFVIGDDVAARTAELLDALEQKGPGELVHPLFGQMRMAVETVETEDRWDKGRYVEFHLAFVEPGEPIYPSSGSDSQAQVNFAADNAEGAARSDAAGAMTDSPSTKDRVAGNAEASSRKIEVDLSGSNGPGAGVTGETTAAVSGDTTADLGPSQGVASVPF